MRKFLFAIIVMGVVLAAGCAGKGDSTEKNSSRLVYGTSDYAAINPALYEHGEINELIFSGLTSRNGRNEIVPELAESWEYDSESMIYVFHLRKDIQFQDGNVVTAEDVKFTIETIQNPENQSEIASNYEEIKEIKVIDEHTLEIVLSSPNAAILDYLTIGILPKYLLDGKNIRTDNFNRNPVGTGPYMLKSWEQGQRITLEKNPYYYGKDPSIDQVIFKITEDGNARAMQLKSGELDLAQIDPVYAAEFLKMNTMEVHVMDTADYRGIMYNYNNEFMSRNKEMVKALSYAIDRKELIGSVLEGYGDEAYSPLQKSAFANEEIEKYSFDPVRAKKELEELGWKETKEGVREKDGEKLAFTIQCMEGDQVRIDMASVCAEQLKKVGADVNIKISAEIDWENQEAFLIGWGSPYDPDDHTYKVFGTNKGSNFNGYSNVKVDNLLKQARETEDISVRKDCYLEFQKVLAEEPPYTYLVYLKAIYVNRKGIKGLKPEILLSHHGVGIFYNIEEWEL